MNFCKPKVRAEKTMVRLDRRILLPILMMACYNLMTGNADAAAGTDPSYDSAEPSTVATVNQNSGDAAASAPSSGAAAPSSQAPSGQLGEVIVTAQKRAENVKDIPISISALTGADLSAQHIIGFEDLSRTVPSVSFAAGAVVAGSAVGVGEDFVEIRGVSSSSGSATTGLYLDDTSISVNQQSGIGAVEPMAVDIARIEVLRGPQGTLYGASSEGGTIRFIENQANLDIYEGHVLGDLSAIDPAGDGYQGSGTNLGANYQAEGVFNAPIVQGKFAIRLNAAYGYDSGWIDDYSFSGNLQKTDINKVWRKLLRLNAVFKATDNLTITGNVFYQFAYQADSPVSDLRDQAYANANSFIIPPPIPSDGLFRTHSNVKQYIDDRLFVPSHTVLYTTNYGDFTSVTSFPYRDNHRASDGTDYDSYYIGNLLDLYTPNPKNLTVIGTLPSPAILTSSFRTFSQEFRFASHNLDVFGMKAHYVAGLYFSNQEEEDHFVEPSIGINAAFQSIYGYGINSALSPIGVPSVPDFWGNDSTQDSLSLLTILQYAGFGQFDVDILPTLHAAVGLRYVHADISSWVYNPPHFFSSTVPGQLWLQPGDQTNTAFTPRFSFTYDVTPQANIYTTIAKGYRLGAPQVPTPPPTAPGNVCTMDYKFLGISAPNSFVGPDDLWSYEIGSKMRLLDNSLSIDVAAYDIEWKNIQQSFILPFCGFPYAANVGNARSYGGELQFAYKPKFLQGLTFALNGNIAHATITETTDPTVVAVGQHILFVPEHFLTISGDYRWSIGEDRSAHVRADYDITGRSYGSYITSNPGYINEPYNTLNGAIGLTIGNLNIDLYGKNLTNYHGYIQTPSVNLLVVGYTVTPLTAGLRVTQSF
jgi:outer membrane receptor protein involved in Fe transport